MKSEKDINAKLLTSNDILEFSEKCARTLGCIPKAVRSSLTKHDFSKLELILMAMEPLGGIPDHPKQHGDIETTVTLIQAFAESAAEDEMEKRIPNGKSFKIEFSNIFKAHEFFEEHLQEARPALFGALTRLKHIMENHGVEYPLPENKKQILEKQRASLRRFLAQRFPSSQIAREIRESSAYQTMPEPRR